MELEEIEDLGASYAFDTGDGRIVFVSGQEFYDGPRFPNSDFTLVDVLDSNGDPVDFHLVHGGRRLEPERCISARAQQELEVPRHLETRPGRLDDLEALLGRAAVEARRT